MDEYFVTYTGAPRGAYMLASDLRNAGVEVSWNPPEEQRGGAAEAAMNLAEGIVAYYICKGLDEQVLPVIQRWKDKIRHGDVQVTRGRHRAK